MYTRALDRYNGGGTKGYSTKVERRYLHLIKCINAAKVENITSCKLNL
jgi:hypothetical protein